MALKKNEFTPDFDAFLNTLSDISHYQYFVACQLKEARERIDSSLKAFKEKGFEEHYFTFNQLSIVNIFHDGKWITRAPAGGRFTKGANLRVMAEEMERRFNAYLLMDAFESLVTLPKDCGRGLGV
jgi:hypothetical protein